MIGTDYYEFMSRFGDDDIATANLLYLESHGLITTNIREIRHGFFDVNHEHLKITAKGIDFVRNDGGLSAILNIQTVKLHRDTVVVLEDLIAISSMNEADKEKAKSTLGELSTEALKTVVQTATTALLAM
ncbi:TPA: hypothetical protein NIY10_003011 [Klebsiella pneumoniae]|nr:hypothetical protein [Klebsiella pneumoniae]HCF6547568.1 hypothetical protein [Klebsiella pneumoniae]HCF8816670.1 hypothetical protein [Klebsiella pneumoniae]HDK6884367.1 hypothetical protein [Klebsiella pneumoniae]